ncbi:hypothetical protein HEP87_11270 [Streptomyces sp. S1D4-11]|nr:hypothetical protein [Streptomyces sp. S1D4-11]QIY94487.1 hypothetical protein HEP87_11270 [Streptomyces sp. S1D4-11]
MTHSPLHRPAAFVRPGWWCSCTTHSDAFHNGAALSKAHSADTPEAATVWMRIAVRTLMSALITEDQDRVHTWLQRGQWEAVMRLKAGEWYGFTARVGSVAVEWTARPVLFLPLLGGRACARANG